MDLELNEDQSELRAIARELLGQRGDLGPARELLDGGGDAAALVAETVELGWLGVGLDADDPFGIPGLCVIAEQVGFHVAPVPLADSAVAARLAAACDGGVPEGAALGELPAAVCAVEAESGWNFLHVGATAAANSAGYRLDARKLDVHHGRLASLLCAIALVDGEPAALLIPADAAGVEIAPAAALDAAAGICAVVFDGVQVPAAACVQGEALRRAFAIGTVATAAEAVGAASRALDLAVEYSLEREQFGRPIGSFQALQHLLADMYVKRETAWSTVLFAAAALDEDSEDAVQTVHVAKAYAARAAREVVEGALQVLGGIGFTWEHDAHLLQRRILECERRYGDEIDHAGALAAALG